jgi:hypothetical protein
MMTNNVISIDLIVALIIASISTDVGPLIGLHNRFVLQIINRTYDKNILDFIFS